MASSVTFKFFFAVVVVALGSGFQYGYSIAVLNAPQDEIQKWIKESSFKDSDPENVDRKTTLAFSAIVSVLCIGGLIGAVSTSPTLDYIGLKWGILMTNVFVFISAALMGFAELGGSFIFLLVGRIFIGINAGLGAGLAPVYLVAISPADVRGAIATCYQLFITIGILIAQVIGLHFILGNEKWPYLFAAMAIVGIFQVICLPFCADSPEYLYDKGKTDEARQALVWFRGTNNVDDELAEIAARKAAATAAGEVSFADMFTKAMYRKPLVICCVVMLAQQFSGINAIMLYSTSTFKAANLDSIAEYGTVGIGLLNVIMTIVAVFVVDTLGRKLLLSISFAAMAVDTLLFFGSFLLATKSEIQMASYACIFFLLVFIVFFAVAAGPIPFFIISELFGQNARGKAVSIVIAVHWISNFTIALTFPLVQDLIGPYVFLIFCVLQVLFLIYIIVGVPETKGKTVEQLTAELNS